MMYEIRQLFEAAGRERVAGRMSDAERLLRQARAEAPRHPLVLNEAAATRLVAGDRTGALVLIEQSLTADPSNPTSWMHKAAILRQLGRDGEAMTALERALSIQPRNLYGLLNMASLHRARGDLRTAAATYRMALQSIPANAELPPELRPLIQEARAAIDAANRELKSFLEARLETLRTRYSNERLDRFNKAMDTLLLKRPVYRPQPSFLHFPHLPAIEFYERSAFPWLAQLEAATADIRAELLDVMSEGSGALEPYITLPGEVTDQWRELNHSRRWAPTSSGARAQPSPTISPAARRPPRRWKPGRRASCPTARRRRCSPSWSRRRESRPMSGSTTPASSSTFPW